MSNQYSPIKPPPLFPISKFCPYCKELGRKFDDHSRENCPEIAKLPPCKICHASGQFGHTQSHCPQNPQIQLKLRKSFKEKCGNVNPNNLWDNGNGEGGSNSGWSKGSGSKQ